MTPSSATEAAIATSRFGFGARPGELAAVAPDPRGWLLAQLGREHPAPPELQGLAPGSEVLAHFLAARELQNRARQQAASDGAAGRDPVQQVQANVREQLLPHYRAQAAARVRLTLTSSESFRERLTQFWSNHFAVSIDKPICLGTAGCQRP